jgi:hypothetical protein
MQVQSHEPGNAVYLNGYFLGYLPAKDWNYSWVAARFEVPARFLRPGWNELVVHSNYLPPPFQGPGFTLDEVLFRGVYMDRALPDTHTVHACE